MWIWAAPKLGFHLRGVHRGGGVQIKKFSRPKIRWSQHDRSSAVGNLHRLYFSAWLIYPRLLPYFPSPLSIVTGFTWVNSAQGGGSRLRVGPDPRTPEFTPYLHKWPLRAQGGSGPPDPPASYWPGYGEGWNASVGRKRKQMKSWVEWEREREEPCLRQWFGERKIGLGFCIFILLWI